MTSEHPVRRHLGCICSDRTMSRVVDPILADARWESGRLTGLGYLTLAKALFVHLVLSTPGVLSRAWSDDERAMPKAVVLVIACTLLTSLPLLLAPLWGVPPSSRPIPIVPLAVLLLPQAIPLALPAALLLAIPLALRRQNPSARQARRTVALSIGCAAAIFVVLAWVMPEANQAFRVMAFRAINGRQMQLERGVNERGFAAMRERIEVLKLTPNRVAARSLEFDYQVRMVLISLPLPTGILALAIARSRRGRRRPWVMGFSALAGYCFVFFPLLRGAGRLMRWSSLPPALFAWMPIVLLGTVAVWIYSSIPAASDSSAAS